MFLSQGLPPSKIRFLKKGWFRSTPGGNLKIAFQPSGSEASNRSKSVSSFSAILLPSISLRP